VGWVSVWVGLFRNLYSEIILNYESVSGNSGNTSIIFLGDPWTFKDLTLGVGPPSAITVFNQNNVGY